MDAVERNGYELIPQPAYSPDLAPSDYFLFPNLKKDIRGRHFRSNEEVAAVEEWVGDKDPGFSSSGLMALEHRWSMHHSRGQLHRKRRNRSHPEISSAVFLLTHPRNSIHVPASILYKSIAGRYRPSATLTGR